MIETFVLFILIFSNARLAAKRGRSGIGWGFITLAAYMLVAGICGAIYIMITYRGPLTPDALQEYVMRVQHNTLKSLTILLFGVGGGLGIRFLLEKMPIRNINRDTTPNA